MFVFALGQAVLAGCVVACSTPTGTITPPERAALAASAPVVTDSACRTLVFTMGDGSTPASASLPNPASCGSGFVLSSPSGTTAGRMSNPRRIYIRVRYRNRSSNLVILPVRLVLPRSGIVIIGSGTAAAVTASNPDTLRGDGTAVWLVGATGTLAIGDSTKVYEPSLKVDEPVQSARLTFEVLAESPSQVPAVAPDSEPAWFLDDSSYTSDRILKRVLTVDFDAAASVAMRQAAIDSISATVIGGYHYVQGDQGTYYIGVPSATTPQALRAAIQVLRRQSQVVHANMIARSKEQYLKQQ